MTGYTHLTLSGDLGSGKTSVARQLAQHLNMKVYSTGELHRQIAAELSQSALEANRTAEIDDSIDRRIDGLTIELGRGRVPMIFDSRMAWHMVEDALRVHLLVDAKEAARRVLNRAATAVERYASLAEASEGLKERSSVERRRFSAKYGVDILALKNYDLIVDTTGVELDDTVSLIESEFHKGNYDRAKLWVDPARVLDLSQAPLPKALEAFVDEISSAARQDELNVFYVAPEFFLLLPEDAQTLRRVRAAGSRLVPANLLADGIDAKEQGIYLARALGDPQTRLSRAALPTSRSQR